MALPTWTELGGWSRCTLDLLEVAGIQLLIELSGHGRGSPSDREPLQASIGALDDSLHLFGSFFLQLSIAPKLLYSNGSRARYFRPSYQMSAVSISRVNKLLRNRSAARASVKQTECLSFLGEFPRSQGPRRPRGRRKCRSVSLDAPPRGIGRGGCQVCGMCHASSTGLYGPF